MAKSKKRAAKDSQLDNTPPTCSKVPKLHDTRKPDKSVRMNAIGSSSDTTPEDEDDPGRTESQQLLTLVRTVANSNKNDSFLRDFRERVAADQQKLDEQLKDDEDKAATDEAAFRDILSSHLSATLLSASAPTIENGPLRSPGGLRSVNKYLTAASKLLQQCQALIKDYDQISQDLSRPILPKSLETLERGWQKDREKVARLLAIGRNVAQKEVSKIVQAQEQQTNTQQAAPSSEDNVEYREASVYFKKKETEDSRLRDALRGAERGVRRIVRELPRDDD